MDKLKRVEQELKEAKLANEKLTRTIKNLKRTYRYNTMAILNECNQMMTKQAFTVTNKLAHKYIEHVKSNGDTKYKTKENDDLDDSDDFEDENEYRYGWFDIVKNFLNKCKRETDEDELLTFF